MKTSFDPDTIESHYLETAEGYYFAVKGLEHPPDRRIAVLRYVPDPVKGERCRDGVYYRRLYHFPEQERWIRDRCPQYRAFDPVFQATLQSVPKSMILRIYNPRLKFQKLVQSSGRCALEDDTVAFLSILRDEAAVPLSSLGITGSILIGMHTGNSDMDVAVFGKKNCRKVYRALRRLLDGGNEKGLGRLDAAGIRELYEERIKDTHMDFPEFTVLEKHKVNQGIFRGRTWFMRFVKEHDETRNTYGELVYAPLGRMKIHASIAEDRDSIFTPCSYALTEVERIGEAHLPDPNEIASFRGRFCAQAHVGDRIMAAGTLERVRNRDEDIRHRLLLGNYPEDTMVVLR